MNFKKLSKTGAKYIFRSYFEYIILIVICYIIIGNLFFTRFWILFLILIVEFTIAILIFYIKNPEILNQRGKKLRNSKKWDIFILSIYYFFTFYLTIIIAALDVYRYNWSNISTNFLIFGVIINILMLILSDWAIIVNVHYERFVRIQNDRNHQVVTNGPYKYIRHPGYAAAIVWNLTVPAIIGSVYAYIPTLIGICFLIIRTYLEDKTLQVELKNYDLYAKNVRYKLFPGIW